MRLFLFLVTATLLAQTPTSMTISRPGDIMQGNLTGVAINLSPYQSSGIILVTLDGAKVIEYDLRKGGSAVNFKYQFPNKDIHTLNAVFSGNSTAAPCSVTQPVYVTPNTNWVMPSVNGGWILIRNQKLDATDPANQHYRFQFQLGSQPPNQGLVKIERSDGTSITEWVAFENFKPVANDPQWKDAQVYYTDKSATCPTCPVSIKQVSVAPFAEDMTVVIP